MIRLTWTISARNKVTRWFATDPRLARSRVAEESELAVLHAARDDGKPVPLSWISLARPDSRRRIESEQDSSTFETYLNAHPDRPYWPLLTAWTIYRLWVEDEMSGFWRNRVRNKPADCAAAQQILVHGSGWLLWEFQLVALAGMAGADASQTERVVEAARSGPQFSLPMEDISALELPDGRSLLEAVRSSCPSSTAMIGHPEHPILGRLLRLMHQTG